MNLKRKIEENHEIYSPFILFKFTFGETLNINLVKMICKLLTLVSYKWKEIDEYISGMLHCLGDNVMMVDLY